MNLENDRVAFDDEAPVKIPSRETDILRMPLIDSALICKILPNPLRDNEAFYEVDLIKHMVGPDPNKDVRYHLSRRMLGDRAPEVDKYWEVIGEMKALKERGEEGSAEYRKLETLKAKFSTNKRYWLLVLPLGATKPKALKVTWRCIKKLFGAPARGKDPAYIGLVETLRAKGRDAMKLKNDKGWIKLYRTGTGLETDYVVEEHMVEKMLEGEEVKVPFSQAVNPRVFDMKIGDVIDVTKLDQVPESLWSADECQDFVDSFGTEIPERCRKRSFQGGGRPAPNSHSAIDSEGDDYGAGAAEGSGVAGTSTDHLNGIF